MAKGKAKKAVKKGGGGRRAKPPTKEETVDISTNMSLLFGNMPPTRDQMYHLQTIIGLEEKAATAQGRVREAKAKAKDAGIDLVAMGLHKKLKRADILDAVTTLRQLAVYFREEGMPVQISLFETKFGSMEEMGAAEGWRDGKAGKSPNSDRWIEGAPGFKEYMRRWNDANRDNLMGDKSAEEG